MTIAKVFVESGENDPLSGKRRVQNVVEQLDVTRAAYRLVLCQEKAQNKVSDVIEKGRRQGCGKRGKGP